MNKLVDQHNNTYYHSIDKEPINADYSNLDEKIETNVKAPKCKINDRVTNYKNIFSNSYTENLSREIFIIDSVLKTNPRIYETNNWNEKEKMIIPVSYEKDFLLSKL